MRRVVVQVVGPEALAACQAIRRSVFVHGQGVPEAHEMDGCDGEATHFLARADGQDVGTARMRVVDGAAKAERVAVLADLRLAGAGREIMRALESEAARRGLGQIVLHAQEDVIPFYEKLGYTAEGPPFQEADIPHRKMRKRL